MLMGCAAAEGATEVSRYKMKDETLRAEYSWVDGCVSKHLEITGSRKKVKDGGGPPDKGTVVSVTYSTYDFCRLPSIEQTFTYGETSLGVVDADGNLRSGRIVVPSLPMQRLVYGGSGELMSSQTLQGVVNVSWWATEPVEKEASTTVTHHAGFHQVSRFQGRYRVAEATGTISDGTQNLMPLAAEGSFAQILRLKSGEVTVVKD